MASLTTTPSGSKQLRFGPGECPTAPGNSRPRIGLGMINARQAAGIALHVEQLCRAKKSGQPVTDATAAWVADLAGKLRGRLEELDLVQPSAKAEVLALGAWIDRWVAARGNVKPATRITYGNARRNLVGFFGETRRIDTITADDADRFRSHLLTSKAGGGEGLSENTARKRCSISKQFFEAARRAKLIDENPFDGIKCTGQPNETRYHFVTAKEAQAILDACPDSQWRLIFALARYGGLRCPSEVLRLRWEDIDWERGRFVVHASKTEHHANGGVRVVPIFPELRPYLLACFEDAEDGAVHCITRYRDPGVNLRTQLSKIIKRAGLTPWPKLLQNLRSTRETELSEQFPMHVVCKWIGNSPQVAQRHYLQVTDDHYREAAADGRGQSAAKSAARQCRPTASQRETMETTDAESPDIGGLCRPEARVDLGCPMQELGVTGLEPVTSSL